MKYLFIIITCCFFVLHADPAVSKPGKVDKRAFSLSIKLVKDEKSKDSSTDEYLVTVHGRVASYKHKHWGRDHKEESFSCTLSEQDYESIKDSIRDQQLNRDLEEKKPDDLIGLSIRLYVVVTLDGRTTSSHVNGMYNIWGADTKSKSNLVNLEYYERIKAVMNDIIYKTHKYER